MKIKDWIILNLFLVCISLIFYTVYLNHKIEILTEDFQLIKNSTIELQEKIDSLIKDNQSIRNSKNESLDTSFIEKYKKLIIISAILSLSVGVSYSVYILIISFFKIPTLGGLVRILEILVLNISAKTGFSKDFIFEFIDSSGREYIFKLSNDSAGLFIKLSENNIIEVGEYISRLASTNITNEIVDITPEIMDIVLKGIM